MATVDLSKPRRYLRADGPKGAPEGVDRDGGRDKAGVIRGVAVITRGEALGHEMWIDGDFLDQTKRAINAASGGVKARFTHPGLSADGLGTFLGRIRNGRRDGDVVRGDLHFSPAAHDTPDGDLADYVMTLAEADPQAFGESIVFEHDLGEEDRFAAKHKDAGGTFRSPDPDNVNHYRHARLSRLRAVDTVDDPAANPDGLFHRGQEIAQDAESLLSYALGVSGEYPSLSALDVEPDRVAGFVTKFMDRHGLTLAKKSAAEEDDDEQEDDETSKAETDDEDDDRDDEEESRKRSKASGQAFLDAFGEKGGVWFAEGKSFDEAQALYVESLKADLQAAREENTKLRDRIESAQIGEEQPVSFAPEGAVGVNPKLAGRLGKNLGRFAGSLRFANDPKTN